MSRPAGAIDPRIVWLEGAAYGFALLWFIIILILFALFPFVKLLCQGFDHATNDVWRCGRSTFLSRRSSQPKLRRGSGRKQKHV
jgi:hypothetical protein